jgi:hypothetical protein
MTTYYQISLFKKKRLLQHPLKAYSLACVVVGSHDLHECSEAAGGRACSGGKKGCSVGFDAGAVGLRLVARKQPALGHGEYRLRCDGWRAG